MAASGKRKKDKRYSFSGPGARFYNVYSDYEDSDWVSELLGTEPFLRTSHNLREKQEAAWDEIRARESRPSSTRKFMVGEFVQIFPLTHEYSFLYGKRGRVLYTDKEHYGVSIIIQPSGFSKFIQLKINEVG